MTVMSANATTEQRYTRGRLSRGQGLRKTTGCLTCRRRHVRCDEDKPACGGCTRLKYDCHYAETPRPRRKSGAGHKKQQARGQDDDNTEGPRSEDESSTPLQLPSFDTPRQLPWTTESPSVRDTHHSPPNHSLQIGSKETRTPHRKTSSFGANSVASPLISRDVDASLPLNSHTPSDSRTVATPQGVAAAPSIASSGTNIESATARWVDLLFQDAAIQDGDLATFNVESDGANIFGNSAIPSPAARTTVSEHLQNQDGAIRSPQSSNPYLLERAPSLVQFQVFEKQAWHSDLPLQMLPHEMRIFQHFVRHMSNWLDLFEPQRPFGTLVPHLAIFNVGLMNAILALSIRHISLESDSADSPVACNANDALQYYYKTLHYIRQAMHYETFKTSLELLATSLIISAYEMLDGSSQDWERHLHGVFEIQRSQIIHGDSGGMRQAVWWAWLCQDVWAAFRERRKPFTFWRPVRTFDELSPHELAARSAYLFAQVIGYCSYEEMEAGRSNPHARITKADALRDMLANWKRYLTVEFEPLPQPTSPDDPFEPIWINPPAFAIAIQLHYCSRILLLLHCPLLGGLESHVELRHSLARYIRIVCGIAMTLSDYGSSIMCSQCLFIAGLALEDSAKRQCILDMLDKCRWRSGWPHKSLSDDLRDKWNSEPS